MSPHSLDHSQIPIQLELDLNPRQNCKPDIPHDCQRPNNLSHQHCLPGYALAGITIELVTRTGSKHFRVVFGNLKCSGIPPSATTHLKWHICDSISFSAHPSMHCENWELCSTWNQLELFTTLLKHCFFHSLFYSCFFSQLEDSSVWKRVAERREGECFIHWFVFQIAAMARVGKGWSQELHRDLPLGWEVPHCFRHHLSQTY